MIVSVLVDNEYIVIRVFSAVTLNRHGFPRYLVSEEILPILRKILPIPSNMPKKYFPDPEKYFPDLGGFQ